MASCFIGKAVLFSRGDSEDSPGCRVHSVYFMVESCQEQPVTEPILHLLHVRLMVERGRGPMRGRWIDPRELILQFLLFVLLLRTHVCISASLHC